MAAAKLRTDIYSLTAIVARLPAEMKNKQQKMTTLFNDVDFYCKNEDIKEVIKLLESEHKATIAWLKSKLKK